MSDWREEAVEAWSDGEYRRAIRAWVDAGMPTETSIRADERARVLAKVQAAMPETWVGLYNGIWMLAVRQAHADARRLGCRMRVSVLPGRVPGSTEFLVVPAGEDTWTTSSSGAPTPRVSH